MYKRIEWENRFSVKVSKMDEQHKIIIKYINSLSEAMDTNDYTKINLAFDIMANYVVTHFKEEEELFDSYGFPGAVTHKLIHKKLLENVGEFAKQISEKRLEKDKFYEFLKMWLTSHIVGIDQKYADYLSTHIKTA